jgi:hypothetical protein
MIAILSAVLLSAALLDVSPEPGTQPQTDVQTVEAPPPLPAVRPKKREKVEEPVRAGKRRERETPAERTPEPAKKATSEPPPMAPVEVIAPPVDVPAPPTASSQVEADPPVVYGKHRSLFRDLVLPLAMLAGGAFVLARVLRKAT